MLVFGADIHGRPPSNGFESFKGDHNIAISMAYADDGTVLNPSGSEKTRRIVPSVCDLRGWFPDSVIALGEPNSSP
jgi:hypothetical protein